MNAKISVSVICLEAIIYFILYNLHGFTFKFVNKYGATTRSHLALEAPTLQNGQTLPSNWSAVSRQIV